MTRPANLAFLLLVLASAICGCEKDPRIIPATQVVVTLRSGLTTELSTIEATVYDVSGEKAGDHSEFDLAAHPFPFSFTVVPTLRATTDFMLLVSGKDAAGKEVLQSKAIVQFVPRSTVGIQLWLNQGCLGRSCDARETCVELSANEAGCAAIPTIEGQPLIAGSELDAATEMEPVVSADAATPDETGAARDESEAGYESPDSDASQPGEGGVDAKAASQPGDGGADAKDTSPTTTVSDASGIADASTPDTGLASLDAGTDAGAPPPPFTGLPQQAYLKARNAEASDQFGTAIALSGSTLVVGAPGEDSSAISVDGNELDNGGANTGAAYVFVKNGNQWVQEAYLKPAAAAVQHFGKSVAVDGDTILVGSDDRAWLYARSQTPGGGRWMATSVFQLPSEALEYSAGGGFGASVALSKDCVAVGAPNSSRGLGDGVFARGSVLLFTPSSGGWQQSYRFLGDSDPNNAQFTDYGAQVALSGSIIAIGAPTDWRGVGISAATPISNAGGVWLFVGSGASWSKVDLLKASNAGAEDRFGSAIALDGKTIAVGAPGEASASGAVLDNQAPNAGAVYVFGATVVTGMGEKWVQQVYLKAPSPRSGDRFGASVSLRGDMLAVGAPGEDSGTGRVYLLRRLGSTWTHQTMIGVLPRDANDNFGSAVALSDDVIAVGTPSEGSNAKGVNAPVVQQSDNSAPGSGATYSFARPF